MKVSDLYRLLEGKTILQMRILPMAKGNTIDAELELKSNDSLVLMIEAIDAPEGIVTRATARRVSAECRRGTMTVDAEGNPFPHLKPDSTGVCVFCGDGAKEPPPEAIEKPITEDRIETVGCALHGSHKLTVHPDGSYAKPDCEMFGVHDPGADPE